MQSQIQQAIALKTKPVALLWADQQPADATEFKKGNWGCIMWLAAGAAKGKTGICSRETFGCFGGGVGMGFGDQYENFPGGKACFCHFLSSGNEGWETGRQAAEKVKPFMRKEAHDHFVHGEGYVKSPQLVEKFILSLPIVDIPARYVVFKPLDAVAADETPRSIIFFVDPDQLSALVVLANYGRGDNENVIIPYAAGCQTIGIYPYREAQSPTPRAVVGLTDLSARVYVKKILGGNLMSFTMPLALFNEMEANVKGSFLERSVWRSLMESKEK
jgi:uncharacterized protein (DUF169 family)